MITVHICNDYSGSEVHKNLCSGIARAGRSPHILTTIRSSSLRSKNMPPPFGVQVEHFEYNNIFVKYFPLVKVLYLYRKVYSEWSRLFTQSRNGSTVLIAHTLWSDGMVAYQLSRKMELPFVLVVRNTDMNIFLPKLPHYRWLIGLMLKRSEAVIFVSEAHRRRFSNTWPKLYNTIRVAYTIPNGIDSYWIKNQIRVSTYRPARICFVGRFVAGKNLKRLITAVNVAREVIHDLECWLIGDTHDELLRITRLHSTPDYIRVIPRVESRNDLRRLYRSCRVMAMPSLRETFGLVYVEALSQGCSVICSQDEGFDGAVDDDAVKVVDPRSIEKISNAIVHLIGRYPKGIAPDHVTDIVGRFSWDRVAEDYMEVINDFRL
mgnify:CR=1 FL=1